MLDGITGINQQSNTQREIALLLEKSKLLRRRMIIKDLKISRVQVADEPAFLVCDREREIYFIHALGDNYAAGTRYPARLCYCGRRRLVSLSASGGASSSKLQKNSSEH